MATAPGKAPGSATRARRSAAASDLRWLAFFADAFHRCGGSTSRCVHQPSVRASMCAVGRRASSVFLGTLAAPPAASPDASSPAPARGHRGSTSTTRATPSRRMDAMRAPSRCPRDAPQSSTTVVDAPPHRARLSRANRSTARIAGAARRAATSNASARALPRTSSSSSPDADGLASSPSTARRHSGDQWAHQPSTHSSARDTVEKRPSSSSSMSSPPPRVTKQPVVTGRIHFIHFIAAPPNSEAPTATGARARARRVGRHRGPPTWRARSPSAPAIAGKTGARRIAP